MVNTFNFYKENKRWYIDLPKWEEMFGEKDSLEMVEGADLMLDHIAGDNRTEVKLKLSDTLVLKNYLDLTSICDPDIDLKTGANYVMTHYNGKPHVQKMWLCDVTQFVFGGFPNIIYFEEVK